MWVTLSSGGFVRRGAGGGCESGYSILCIFLKASNIHSEMLSSPCSPCGLTPPAPHGSRAFQSAWGLALGQGAAGEGSELGGPRRATR